MHYVSLAERPELEAPMLGLQTSWPEFMLHDPTAARLWGRLPGAYPQLQLVALEGSSIVAKVHAVGFHWSGDLADLPSGWDDVLATGLDDAGRGLAPTAVSLLEAAVRPDLQGRGLAAGLLAAARTAVAGLGLRDLFGPVRPNGKAAEPWLPVADYVARRRDDGLPADPWLRTHARLGAELVRICPVSMTIPAPLARWREWTGLPLDVTGPVAVPGALVPVHCDVEQDHAVYVEPNVWMHHRIG